MRWSGTGFVLGFKKYNESSYILDAFTEDHGRHKGLIRGIHSKNLRAVIEPGNEVMLNWSGRLESHLGNYTCLLYTSPSPRDATLSRMPSSA